MYVVEQRGSTEVVSVSAVICTSAQEERLDAYFRELLGREELLPERSKGASRRIDPEGRGLIKAGMSAADVLATIGPPSDIWPRRPNAFSWHYTGKEPVSTSVVIDFDQAREIENIRDLGEPTWE
jgi:hypothetical protein